MSTCVDPLQAFRNSEPITGSVRVWREDESSADDMQNLGWMEDGS